MKRQFSPPRGPRPQSVSPPLQNEVAARFKKITYRAAQQAQVEKEKKESLETYSTTVLDAYSQVNAAALPTDQAQQKPAQRQAPEQPAQARSYHRLTSLPFGYIWCATERPTQKELARLAAREEQRRGKRKSARYRSIGAVCRTSSSIRIRRVDPG
jgi:hypothetical protein